MVYHKALNYIRHKSRVEGFDAAIRYLTPTGEFRDFDSLLLFDRQGAGQQMAAQAGTVHRVFIPSFDLLK